jgi:hypothetical protein
MRASMRACVCVRRGDAMVRLFLEALDWLVRAVEERATVAAYDEFGEYGGYTQYEGSSCAHVWQYDRVIVLHPIDPTCNLARVSGCGVDTEAGS